MPSREERRRWNEDAREANRIERQERRDAPSGWSLWRESNRNLRAQDREERRIDRPRRRKELPNEKGVAKARRKDGDTLDRIEREARRGETPEQRNTRIAGMLGIKPPKKTAKAAQPQPKGSGKAAKEKPSRKPRFRLRLRR